MIHGGRVETIHRSYPESGGEKIMSDDLFTNDQHFAMDLVALKCVMQIVQ